jgi:hypothetical protein
MSSAYASDWVMMEQQPGERSTLDRLSIQQNGPLIRVWVKTDWDTPHVTNPGAQPITEWLGRYLINCDTRQVSALVADLKNRGVPVAYSATPTAPTDIVPDTPMERLAAQLCRK